MYLNLNLQIAIDENHLGKYWTRIPQSMNLIHYAEKYSCKSEKYDILEEINLGFT